MASSRGVTPPELVSFVEAEYPARARAEGVNAEVTLILDIDEEGRVTAAEVSAGAGQGFDEAAVSAARRFLFKPARRGDRPVKSRILYRYRFELQNAPVEEAAQSASQLRGRVLISETNQPLAGATVRVSRGAESLGEQTTDEHGRFELRGLSAGQYRVQIEAAGFEAAESVEEIGASEEVSVDYRLSVKATLGAEVVVSGERPHREVTRRNISRREFTRVPGTSGDALRAIQNLPGVARPPALSGVLVVRGNADQSTPIFVDGLWFPNIYHFGGLSSVVPSEMLDDIDFYPGNFSVRFGRSLAGVVDAHLRETRADGRYHGLLGLDLIDARAMLEGPIPGLKGWNFIAGFRRSHVDAWLAPLLESKDTQIDAAPVYYDYQFIADTRPTEKSYLRVGLLGFDDRFRAIDQSSAGGGAAAFGNSVIGVGSIYQVAFSEATRAEFTLSAARSHQRFLIGSLDLDIGANAVIARADFSHRLHPNATLRAGVDALGGHYNLKGFLPDGGGAGAPDLGPALTRPSQRLDRETVFTWPAAYAELSVRSGRMQVVGGIRGDYSLEHEAFTLSPRLTARYTLFDSPKTALKAGSGMFYQAPDLVETALSTDPTKLRSQRTFQNSLGIEQALGSHLELSLEGFLYLLDDLVVRRPNAAGVLDYDNSGTGRIYGAELMLRYPADEHFFGWVSYTLSRSERTWTPGQPSQLFYLDQPQILTVLGSYTLGRGWEIGTRFRYVSGNLYTPCNGGLFSSVATSYVCVSGPENSQRLPAFHQLDLRVDKRWVFSAFTLGVYLDLINVYNRINADAPSFSYDFTKQSTASQSLPFLPSLGIRGEF